MKAIAEAPTPPPEILPGEALAQAAGALLNWYEQVHEARAMPWRKMRDPYAVWISEIMLQQTQVETVKPFFGRFLARFPTVGELAQAPLEEVLAHWAGLGYYRRAKHLHAAAKKIAAEHGGKVPGTLEALRGLPGIGRYTAGAIASIAFGLPAAVVDGNVMRVISRLTGFDRDIALPKHHEFFWRAAEKMVAAAPRGRFGDLNQALMELGATVCVPALATPACLLCPLKNFCRAFAQGRQAELPVKSAKKEPRILRGTAFAIFQDAGSDADRRREVLLMRRPQGGIWEGMWEFPTVAGTNGQTLKELGLCDPEPCGKITHTLTHRSIRLNVIRGRLKGNRLPAELPVCLGAKGRYESARWQRWPLQANNLPMARIVHKIAELVLGAVRTP